MTDTEVFDARSLQDSMQGSSIEYLEFLKLPGLSCGIYHLSAGSEDPQQPHDEDEIYYVLEGKGSFTSGDTTQSLTPGSIIFVAKEVQHSFENIEEDLALLVFFASNS